MTAGRTAWQEDMYDDLKEVSRAVTREYLQVNVGLDYPHGGYEEMRAFVMTYGSGSKGTPPGDPIHAGPYGRIVWDDQLWDQKQSESLREYDLPDEFNQRGYNWLDNAMKRMRTEMEDIIRNALARIPPGLLASAITIS